MKLWKKLKMKNSLNVCNFKQKNNAMRFSLLKKKTEKQKLMIWYNIKKTETEEKKPSQQKKTHTEFIKLCGLRIKQFFLSF